MRTIHLIEPQWTSHEFLNQRIHDELLSTNFRVAVQDINSKNKPYGISRLYMIFRAHLTGLKKHSKSDHLIFLSYHTYCMFFALFFFGFKRKNIYVFEHNNVDRLGKNRFYDFIYKRLNKYVISFCFEEYILEYIEKKYMRSSIYIPHPIKEKIYNSRICKPPCLFSPSGQISDKTKNYLSSLNMNIKMFLKGEDEDLGNLQIKSFFENYDQIFSESNVILFDHIYQYRVSNVLYEAVEANKIILSKRCLFSSHISKYYTNIYFYDEIDEIKEIDLKNLISKNQKINNQKINKNLKFSVKLNEIFV